MCSTASLWPQVRVNLAFSLKVKVTGMHAMLLIFQWISYLQNSKMSPLYTPPVEIKIESKGTAEGTFILRGTIFLKIRKWARHFILSALDLFQSMLNVGDYLLCLSHKSTYLKKSVICRHRGFQPTHQKWPVYHHKSTKFILFGDVLEQSINFENFTDINQNCWE